MGIWLFPVVGVGQLLVALVHPQLSARIPLSGGTYAWASRLANPRVGWAFGWLAVGGGLMAATLMGLSALVGFETAANMSEETTNATRDVSRAIIGSVLASAGRDLYSSSC